MMNTQQDANNDRTRILTALLILGFALLAIGVILTIIASVSSSAGNAVNSGVIVFIGPIPIALGTGPNAQFTLTIAAIFAALMLVALLIMTRRTRETK